MLIENQILSDCYQILQPIGKGGTSSVYLAYHLRLQKYVVIKKLRGTVTDPVLLRTEADILKNLHHQGLPQVYDYIQEQDHVYTVIDYVDGYDLDTYIRSGTKLPEPHLKRYLRQIADVLDYLHTQPTPVIHSDIKPGNIIINQHGNAILIDFNTSIGANQGNLLGLTLPYASPEQIMLARYAVSYQCHDFSLDTRSDLYSLGASFYELISGIQPTPGVRPVPLQSMSLPDYSKEFTALIDRMMDYDRDTRIQSARKLILTLDRMDGRFWAHFAKRCISFVLSSALIAGGLYCLITGMKLQKAEDYHTACQMAASYVNQGNLDKAESTYQAVLNDPGLQNYIQKHPTELARLYHVIGDVSYYRGDYAAAAAYYNYAFNGVEENSIERIAYLRDAAIAYANSGNLNTARSLLDLAQTAEASSSDLQLIRITIDARSGNMEQCIAGAGQLLQECQDARICSRAAMCVATAAQDSDTRIQWLLTARKYDTGTVVLRELASAYAQKAENTSGAAREEALAQSVQYYRQLSEQAYPSAADLINYSVVLRMSDRHDQARSVLEQALLDDAGNYRIHMALGSVCYDLGDRSAAARYCSEALQAWKADTSQDKLSEGSKEIQSLMELSRRLGVGGI